MNVNWTTARRLRARVARLEAALAKRSGRAWGADGGDGGLGHGAFAVSPDGDDEALFGEYTPVRLAQELQAAGAGLDAVEVVIRDLDGNTVIDGVMQLRLEFGHDVDRSGGYRWMRIVGQQEEQA